MGYIESRQKAALPMNTGAHKSRLKAPITFKKMFNQYFTLPLLQPEIIPSVTPISYPFPSS